MIKIQTLKCKSRANYNGNLHFFDIIHDKHYKNRKYMLHCYLSSTILRCEKYSFVGNLRIRHESKIEIDFKKRKRVFDYKLILKEKKIRNYE